jgi:hypothetical protein
VAPSPTSQPGILDDVCLVQGMMTAGSPGASHDQAVGKPLIEHLIPPLSLTADQHFSW